MMNINQEFKVAKLENLTITTDEYEKKSGKCDKM